MTGKFEISSRSNGEFQFNLKTGKGQVILSSEGYSSLPACQMGVESVRMHSVNPTHFECKTAKDGSPYFSLKASNGQIIGKSEMYSSVSACDNGIQAVMTNAPGAEVLSEIA
ncbi:YegP family protein [Thermomonas sp.]|uniref:YegP family protein n=1 Tax=Thermomonas sp. TaxID=1971895 RepID=UPI002486FA4B|nr:YegP family protein [Thermomonas sp.]MDI1251829.1 YegP family protein [Thermomonas sp.]